MPELDDILGGRVAAMAKGGAVNGQGKFQFFFFLNTVLECVAGRKEWKAEKTKLLVSKSCVTVSDEAFAMLLLVNSWDKFQFIASNPDNKDKNELPSTRYTEKKGRNKKFLGWSQEGINHFNQLCKFVMEDRSSDAGKDFEKEFLQYHQDEMIRKKAAGAGFDCDENEVQDDDDGSLSQQHQQAYHQLDELCDMESVVGDEEEAVNRADV